jgi:hypothetical protein
MEIPEMESSPVKKSPKQEPPKPRRSYWIYVLILCIVIVGALWLKMSTDGSTKPPPVVIPQPEEPTPPKDSYTELATLLCGDKFNWCQMSDTTPAEVESELRGLITDSEQVTELVISLKQDDTNVFSSLQILSPQFSHSYLTDALTDFEPYDFKQIVNEQTKLRTVFIAFQSFANRIPSSDTGADSEVAPLSSFAYKATKAFKDIEEELKNLSTPETKHSPFFSDSDLLKAKFLKNVVEDGRDNRVFNVNERVKVFTALCQLTDDNVVEVGYDSEGELRDLCITPNPDQPTQQKCEVLDETKNMAEAFLELRENLNQQLTCEK